jgi:hypothetical protein
MVRTRFNDILRKYYSEKEPFFDLAKAESTFPDGKRETFEVDGKTYEAMVPMYSDDGGHLNELGRSHIAVLFLLTLINNCR